MSALESVIIPKKELPAKVVRLGWGLTLLGLALVVTARVEIPVVLGERRRGYHDAQPVTGVEVTVRGQRRDEHPTVITSIELEFVVHGDVDPARVEHALKLSEAQICPVWAMLKVGTPITSSYNVVTG